MPQYVVIWRTDKDREYTIAGERWLCGVADFPGTTQMAATRFARMIFYGGDGDGEPRNYVRAPSGAEVLDVLVLPLKGAIPGDIAKIRADHIAWHDADEEKRSEADERAEYERLRVKFQKK